MSHTDEIAKQDSIRVKITWRVGDAKHEVEYDARAIEMKRNSTLNYYKTWTLTLLETPRFFNVEEGPPSTPAPERTPPVPATCCGPARMEIGPDSVVRLAEDRLRRETEQLRAVNEELRGAVERGASIFAEPRSPR